MPSNLVKKKVTLLRRIIFLVELFIFFLWIEYRSWTFILRQSDNASYRETDDIKFIHFYQWMLFGFIPFFWYIVRENKNLKKVNLFDKFQRPLCQQLHTAELKLFNEIVCHYYEMHSLITPVPCDGRACWYKTFMNHAYLAINLQKCRVLLIDGSVIANFSKFSSIFDKHFLKFNTLNFGIGGDKIQLYYGA